MIRNGNKQGIMLETIALIFEFTEEEDDAIRGLIPMTQDRFNLCMIKCEKIGIRVNPTYQKLVTKYPEFWKTYQALFFV